MPLQVPLQLEGLEGIGVGVDGRGNLMAVAEPLFEHCSLVEKGQKMVIPYRIQGPLTV